MNQFKLILSQFRELFLRMSGTQKLSIFLFGGAIFILMLAVIVRGTTPDSHNVLFYKLSHSKAAEIRNKLNDMGVDSIYEDSAILIPADINRDDIKLKLAEEELLPDDLSYDFRKMLEENGINFTRDERDRRYDIALGTEVGKMLTKLDSIDSAKVQISREEPSPLLKQHDKRTASVSLSVKGKRKLSRKEAEGIARLVASSVKSLAPESVTILDSKGNSYNFNDEVDANEKFMMERQQERILEEKIELHLSQFIPKVKATVAIKLDLQKKRKEIKDFQHKDLNGGAFGAVTNETTEKENSNSREGSKGVAGAGTDTSAEIKEGDGGTNMDMSKSKKLTNFDNSLVNVFIEEDGGEKTIESVSVVVANKRINGDFNSNLPESETNKEYEDVDWSKATPSLEEQIAGIIGMGNMEKITVSIQEMLLPRTPPPAGTMEKIKTGTNWTFIAMIGFAVIGAFILLSMVKKAQPEEEIVPMPEYEEEMQESNLPPLKEPEMDASFKQVENRVKELVDEDPVKAAGLVRHWLSGD